MDFDIIKVITEFGSVGIAVYCLYTLKHLVGNHLTHGNEALIKLEKSITKLTQFLEDKFNA